MPRRYQRKTAKASWTSEALQAALLAIESGRAVPEVSRSFGIARATLQGRHRTGNVSKPQLGRRPLFSAEQEIELLNKVITLLKLFYGIWPSQIKQSAYTFTRLNNIKNPFKDENETAGRDWLKGFLRLNPQIRLRKPKSTSVNRVTAFNKAEMEILRKSWQFNGQI